MKSGPDLPDRQSRPCMVLEGLLTDYMAKGGLAAIGDYIEDWGLATRRLSETMEESKIIYI